MGPIRVLFLSSLRKWNAQIRQELQAARQHSDELALAHSDLEKRSVETAAALQSSKEQGSLLRNQLHELEGQVGDVIAERTAEYQREQQALVDRYEEVSSSLAESTAREVTLRRERDAAVQARSELVRSQDEASARAEKLKGELDVVAGKLREAERQSATLEIRHIEISKKVEKLTDDNAGLYMALEGKQQELSMVRDCPEYFNK